jgi:hypothetical protein
MSFEVKVPLSPLLDALDCNEVVLLRVGELRIGLLFKLPRGSIFKKRPMMLFDVIKMN